MYGFQDKINQILRGAETIKKNSMNPDTTNACAECELTDKTKEIARLKEMVMDAAKRGDKMAAHWKERAERAEAIIQQLHHFAGIIEGFQNTTKMNPAHTPEEPVSECQDCGVTLATAEQINKRCSPCMLERKFEAELAQLAPTPEEPETSAHIDKCIGNVTEPANPTCANTTHKHSYCDCKEPVSLDPAPKFTHEGNTDAKFKQLHKLGEVIEENHNTANK